MTAVCSRPDTKSISIYAQVIRADGTKGPNQLKAFYHKNPAINWVVNKYIKLKDKL